MFLAVPGLFLSANLKYYIISFDLNAPGQSKDQVGLDARWKPMTKKKLIMPETDRNRTHLMPNRSRTQGAQVCFGEHTDPITRKGLTAAKEDDLGTFGRQYEKHSDKTRAPGREDVLTAHDHTAHDFC